MFAILNKRAGGKTCEAMKGVLEESSEAMEAAEPGAVRDAAIIAAAQRSEHYEMAAYGTVVALAKALGQAEIEQLLTETLEQEKAADKQLTAVSKTVNKQALSGAKSKDAAPRFSAHDGSKEDFL